MVEIDDDERQYEDSVGVILINDDDIELTEDGSAIRLSSASDLKKSTTSSHSKEISIVENGASMLDEDEEDATSENTPLEATPIPKMKIFAIFIIMLNDAINALSLFPYVNFMVKDFHLTEDEKAAGYYVGFLASSYYFSQLFSSFFWGWFSNRYGRRPAVFCGLVCSMCSLIGFGLSTNYYMAVIFRFSCGLLNGNVSVTKTMLGEITDSTNQARAFSFIGLSWSIGGIVAPLIGGIFSNVCSKPQFEGKLSPNNLFCKYPYLLPNVVCFSLSALGLVLAHIYLQETLSFKVSKKSSLKSTFLKLKLVLYKLVGKNIHQQLVNKDQSSSDLVDLERVSGQSDIFREEDDDGIVNEAEEDMTDGPRSVWELLRDKPVLYSTGVYALLGFSFTIFEECFPQWSSIPREKLANGKLEDGGYGFDSVDIGFIQSFAGICALFIQTFIFPPLVKRLGLVRAFQLSTIIAIPSFILLPELSNLTVLYPGESTVTHSAKFWAMLFPSYLFQSFAGEILFISVIVMISNSCLPKDMALVNSIGMFLVSISRTVGPIIGSSLLTFTISRDLPFPFDYHFIFVLEIILFLSLLVLALFFLPNSLNHTKQKSIALAEIDSTSGPSLKSSESLGNLDIQNDDEDNFIKI